MPCNAALTFPLARTFSRRTLFSAFSPAFLPRAFIHHLRRVLYIGFNLAFVASLNATLQREAIAVSRQTAREKKIDEFLRVKVWASW